MEFGETLMRRPKKCNRGLTTLSAMIGRNGTMYAVSLS